MNTNESEESSSYRRSTRRSSLLDNESLAKKIASIKKLVESTPSYVNLPNDTDEEIEK